MEQNNDPEYPIEDALIRAQVESFIALHRDTDMLYAVCQDSDKCSELVQAVVMIHHSAELWLVCREHYITMCELHSGPLIEMALLWKHKPIRIYAN